MALDLWVFRVRACVLAFVDDEFLLAMKEAKANGTRYGLDQFHNLIIIGCFLTIDSDDKTSNTNVTFLRFSSLVTLQTSANPPFVFDKLNPNAFPSFPSARSYFFHRNHERSPTTSGTRRNCVVYDHRLLFRQPCCWYRPDLCCYVAGPAKVCRFPNWPLSHSIEHRADRELKHGRRYAACHVGETLFPPSLP